MRPTGSMPGRHRGLTLIEVMLSLAVTTMITSAIAMMTHSVASGIVARTQTRHLLTSNVKAAAIIQSYTEPARSVLDLGPHRFTLWQNDARQSGTVHATEIRWFAWDPGSAILSVSHVLFPENMSDEMMLLLDMEYTPETEWELVLDYYRARGQVNRIDLVHGVFDFDLIADATAPADVRILQLDLRFLPAEESQASLPVIAALHRHEPPRNLQ